MTAGGGIIPAGVRDGHGQGAASGRSIPSSGSQSVALSLAALDTLRCNRGIGTDVEADRPPASRARSKEC